MVKSFEVSFAKSVVVFTAKELFAVESAGATIAAIDTVGLAVCSSTATVFAAVAPTSFSTPLCLLRFTQHAD